METPASKAVFLSYASQDAEAARMIADALRASGVEVWFDRSALRGGEAWDQKIRRQIKECALFAALVSGQTEARGEGYFRLEWKLADERTNLMAKGVPFLLPIAVDAVSESEALVPDSFRTVQWTHLPAGVPTPQFLEQVRRLLEAPHRPPAVSGPAAGVGGRGASVRSVAGRRRTLTMAMVLFAVAAGVGGSWWVVRRTGPASAQVEQSPARLPAPVAPEVRAKSLAVLPFQYLGSAREDDYLSDGITQEILNTLGRVPGLRVAARSSSFLFKDRREDPRRIGELLQVGTLLEGTVRKSGSQLRVSADLIDTSNGFRLWTETYDREMTGIFAIQDEIARAIVAKLQASMSESVVLPVNRRRTRNIEAYEWYLKGVFHLEMLSESGFTSALDCFQHALARQPDYAPAYSGLAQAYFWQRFFAYVPPGEVVPQSRRAVAKALELDPQLADTQLSDATMKFYVDRDWTAAERAFRRALELDQGLVHAHWFYGLFLAAMKRPAESRTVARRAQELDPLSLTTKVVTGWIHWYNGDFGLAAELGNQAAKVAADFYMAHWLAAMALFRQGNRAEGVAMMERTRGFAPVTDVLADLGWMYGRVGRTKEARQILDELKDLGSRRFVPAYSLASVYDGLGDLGQTDYWLRKAIDDREAMVVMMNTSSDEITRAHPQFHEWMQRLGVARPPPMGPTSR